MVELYWFAGGFFTALLVDVIFQKVIMAEYKKLMTDLKNMKAAYELEVAKLQMATKIVTQGSAQNSKPAATIPVQTSGTIVKMDPEKA